MRHLVLPLAVATLGACHGASAPPDADEAMACLAAGRGETFTVGLDHHGASGALDFKLMSATPAPPGFNNNTWILQISQMAAGVVGAPATGATITVTPFMPDHQHGTGIKAKIEAMPEAGQYKLSPINLWMPGYWEITIDAQAGAAHDSSVFKFCIQA
jgi:YtkA-like